MATTREEVRDKNPGAGEQAGEAVGGIGGVLTGAAIGSAAGPVGTIVGGIAGAVGGWWAGEKVGRAAEDLGDHDDVYRRHYTEHPIDGVDYDTARVGYTLGHLAGRNPDYEEREFDAIEADIRNNWNWDAHDYDRMRPYVRYSYDRARDL